MWESVCLESGTGPVSTLTTRSRVLVTQAFLQGLEVLLRSDSAATLAASALHLKKHRHNKIGRQVFNDEFSHRRIAKDPELCPMARVWHWASLTRSSLTSQHVISDVKLKNPRK